MSVIQMSKKQQKKMLKTAVREAKAATMEKLQNASVQQPQMVLPQMMPQGPQQASQPSVLDRIVQARASAVIITNTEPEALIYCVPTLRAIYKVTGIASHIFITQPQNPSFISLIAELPYVKEIRMCEKIDENFVNVVEKDVGPVTMLNIGAAMQAGMQRGIGPVMSLGATIGVPLGPSEAGDLEVSISRHARTRAENM